VLTSRLDTQLAQVDAVAAFSRQIRSAVAARRAAALAELVPALQSGRFSRLLQMLDSGAEEPAAGGGQPIGPFARKRIDKAFRKLVPWIDQPPETLGEAELHRIRILFKRLRYACEFFRPLLGGPAEGLIGSFVSFQDCLGLHQDAAAAVRLLTDLLQQAPADVRTESFLLSIGSLIQVQRSIQLSQREKFLGLWESAPRLLESWKKLRAQAGVVA